MPYLVECGWRVHVLSTGSGADIEGDGFTVYRDRRPKLLRRAGTLAAIAGLVSGGALGRAARLARLMPVRSWFSAMTRASLGAGIMRRHRIDVISAYNLLGGAPAGALLAEMFGTPLVVTNLGEVYSHPEVIGAHRSLIAHITRRAATLLAPTEHCGRTYRQLGLDPPVRVIHHGIDVAAFEAAPDRAEARARLGMSPAALVVGFVGRLNSDMGVDTFLDAAPAILTARADTALLIAGGQGPLAPAAEDVVRRWPGRATLNVNVPDARLPAVYAASDLIVAPTRGQRACGSLAAAEAMATGRPVVAARVGGIPEFVIAGETGILIPPGDPGALAKAVLDLAGDQDRRAAMAAAGRRHVREAFDRVNTNRAFEAVFRAALKPVAA